MKHIPIYLLGLIVALLMVFQNCGGQSFESINKYPAVDQSSQGDFDPFDPNDPNNPNNEACFDTFADCLSDTDSLFKVIGFPNSMKLEDGEKKTVSVSAVMNDESVATFSYQWKLSGTVIGGDSDTLEIDVADINKEMGSVLALLVTHMGSSESKAKSMLISYDSGEVSDGGGSTQNPIRVTVQPEPIPSCVGGKTCAPIALVALVNVGTLTPGDTKYQWQKAPLWDNNYSNISGATTGTYVVASPNVNHSGRYRLRITHPDATGNVYTQARTFKYSKYSINISLVRGTKQTCKQGYAVAGMTYHDRRQGIISNDKMIRSIICKPLPSGTYSTGTSGYKKIDNLSGSYYAVHCGAGALLTGTQSGNKSGDNDFRTGYIRCQNQTLTLGSAVYQGSFISNYNATQTKICPSGSYVSGVYFDDKSDNGIYGMYCKTATP